MEILCSCHGNLYMYQVSSPCVLLLGEVPEAIYVVVMETCSCHGNDIICMRTKFHLYKSFH